jgi:hypothetical protein
MEDWNCRFADVEGVFLQVKEGAVGIASSIGGKIIADHFPPAPDAYKRVATLLVVMSLHPFINGRRKNREGCFVEVLQGEQLRYFGLITLVDSIGTFFDSIEQQNDAGMWVRMNNWPGLPTGGIRDELIHLLYSYSKSDVVIFKDEEFQYDPLRLYQAILSASLIFKSVYPV